VARSSAKPEAAPYTLPKVIEHSVLLVTSFRRWTDHDLIDPGASPEICAKNLYHAPFVLLSHDMQPDPIFSYANLSAQKLWNYSWKEFMHLHSRVSAAPDATAERQHLLDRAMQQGYVNHYSGVRVTKAGKKFHISDAIVWNVVDAKEKRHGQAVIFSQWTWLEDS
jgi:hypothetical protein